MPQTINGHAHASKERKTHRPTFVARTTVRCPDCDIEERLDPMGLPRARHRTPLKPQSGRIPYDPRSSFGCETCAGTGRIKASRPKKGCSSNDPMEIPGKG